MDLSVRIFSVGVLDELVGVFSARVDQASKSKSLHLALG